MELGRPKSLELWRPKSLELGRPKSHAFGRPKSHAMRRPKSMGLGIGVRSLALHHSATYFLAMVFPFIGRCVKAGQEHPSHLSLPGFSLQLEGHRVTGPAGSQPAFYTGGKPACFLLVGSGGSEQHRPMALGCRLQS